jgi:hypothetical protein
VPVYYWGHGLFDSLEWASPLIHGENQVAKCQNNHAPGSKTFDYRFDLSEHDIILEDGKEYIMWLRAVGEPSTGQVRLAYSAVTDVVDFGTKKK